MENDGLTREEIEQILGYVADTLLAAMDSPRVPRARWARGPAPIQYIGVIEIIGIQPFDITARTQVSWN